MKGITQGEMTTHQNNETPEDIIIECREKLSVFRKMFGALKKSDDIDFQTIEAEQFFWGMEHFCSDLVERLGEALALCMEAEG